MHETAGSGQPTADNSGRYAIDAVVNALTLLGEFTRRDSVGLSEAATIVGSSRSTAYRLLVTLEANQLIERLPEGGYRAGERLITWSAGLLSQLDVRRVAGPTLRLLWEETGETVNLAVLRGSGLIYIDILESASTLRMADTPGSLVPLHATALGKAVAAYLDPPRLARYLGIEPYATFSPRTCTTWADLSRQLNRVRVRGYAVDVEEHDLGGVCVGAPILVDGSPIAAISVSGPRIRFDSARLDEIGSRIRSLTDGVAAKLSPNSVSKPTVTGRGRASRQASEDSVASMLT
jgi:IclR family acetate operon transcriptional repressor